MKAPWRIHKDSPVIVKIPYLAPNSILAAYRWVKFGNYYYRRKK